MALVKLHKGKLRVSHQDIAKNINYNAEDLKATIVKYGYDFKELGTLPFKTMDNNDLLRIYYLNEQQATLLLSYLENREVVRKFKVLLIKAFHKKRKKLNSKNSLFKSDIKINRISKALESEIERNIKLTKEYRAIKRELLESLDKNYEAKEFRKIAKKELLAIGGEFNDLQLKLSFLAKTLEDTAVKILKIS